MQSLLASSSYAIALASVLALNELSSSHAMAEPPPTYAVADGTINPLKPEFIIVIFIHYKPRIAVAILDL